jgi:hypothetical protein
MYYLESSIYKISSLYIYINEWLGMTSVSLDIHHVTYNHQKVVVLKLSFVIIKTQVVLQVHMLY